MSSMLTPPELSQLRALVFCREVTFTAEGVDLGAVHDRRFSPTFPVRFEDLVLYASFQTPAAGPHTVQLWWRHNDGEIGLLDETVVRVTNDRVVRLRQPFGREFPGPGVYAFALYCEGALIGATSLEVHQIAPAPTA